MCYEAEAKAETERLKIESEKARRDAEADQLRLEAAAVKARMEHEYRMREIEIRDRDTGGGGDAEMNRNKVMRSMTHLPRRARVPHPANKFRHYLTSGSAVAKRPGDASCLSVVSFNSIKRPVESFIVSYVGYRFVTACS